MHRHHGLAAHDRQGKRPEARSGSAAAGATPHRAASARGARGARTPTPPGSLSTSVARCGNRRLDGKHAVHGDLARAELRAQRGGSRMQRRLEAGDCRRWPATAASRCPAAPVRRAGPAPSQRRRPGRSRRSLRQRQPPGAVGQQQPDAGRGGQPGGQRAPGRAAPAPAATGGKPEQGAGQADQHRWAAASGRSVGTARHLRLFGVGPPNLNTAPRRLATAKPLLTILRMHCTSADTARSVSRRPWLARCCDAGRRLAPMRRPRRPWRRWPGRSPCPRCCSACAGAVGRQRHAARGALRRTREDLRQLEEMLDLWQWHTDTAHRLTLLRAPAGGRAGRPHRRSARRCGSTCAAPTRQHCARGSTATRRSHDVEVALRRRRADAPARRALLRGRVRSRRARRFAGYTRHAAPDRRAGAGRRRPAPMRGRAASRSATPSRTTCARRSASSRASPRS